MSRRNAIIITSLVLLTLFTVNCRENAQKIIFQSRQHLKLAPPESVGMSSERLARIDKVINQYIENKWLPGAVALIARHGKIVYYKNFGTRDFQTKETLQKDDIFRIASMSKGITVVAVMMLYEEGKFLLDDPISKYIPEFKNPKILLKVNKKDSTYTSKPSKNEITIRNLLTHTSGIGYAFQNPKLSIIYQKAGVPGGFVRSYDTLANKMKTLGKLPLLHEPGERWTYGLSHDVLGYFVEVISGMSFDEFLQERIFKPLGMNDTYFYLTEEKKERLVPVFLDIEDGKLKEYHRRWYTYPIKGKTYFSGGGGLSSTTLDYAKFIQMLLNNGEYNNVRLLSRKTVELIRTNQIGDLWGDSEFGLGFGITSNSDKSQKLSSVGNYWWGGYFGTSFWIDPEEDLIGVLMKQVYSDKHEDLNEKFEILTYQAIVN